MSANAELIAEAREWDYYTASHDLSGMLRDVAKLATALEAAEAELTRRDTVIAGVWAWCHSHDRPDAPPNSREDWMLSEVTYVAGILRGSGYDSADAPVSTTDAELGRFAWEAVHEHGAFRRDFPDDDYFKQVGSAVRAALAAAPVSLEAVKAETTAERCDQCAAPEMSFEQARELERGLALCTAHWNRWVIRWINSDDEPGVSAHLIQGVTHAAPTGGSGVMPCCGRTPFEVSPTQRITLDPESVTCIPDATASTEGDDRG